MALSPEIGAPFDERCMVHFGEDDVVNVSEAQVAKVLCSGLKGRMEIFAQSDYRGRDPRPIK